MTWISIPCPKHTFLLVVVQLQTCGQKFSPLRFYVILEQWYGTNGECLWYSGMCRGLRR